MRRKTMTNSVNILDIDGDLIRAAGDNHEITAEEARESIKKYEDKLKAHPDETKAAAYRTYIKNLTLYVFTYYQKHPEALQEALKQQNLQEQVSKAMEELKSEVDKEEPKETVMDEYVDFEEVKKDEKSE